MANSILDGLTRVTIVAPRTQIDIALPSDVPLADLLPTLLRYADEPPKNDPAGQHGWSLSRLAGPTFDADCSPAMVDIRDGEILYLRLRDAGMPEPVFDDVVDAIATATQDRSGRWGPSATRQVGSCVGISVLLTGVLMLLLTGRGAAGLPAVGTAVVLVAAATILSRVAGDSRAGVLVGLVAVCYAGAGGLLIFLGGRLSFPPAAASLLLAGVAIMLAAAITAVGVADGAAAFLAACMCGAALVLGAVVCMVSQAAPAGAAAIVATFAFASTPTFPMLSYRLAGLPVPSVPIHAEDLKANVDVVDGARVLALGERADQLLGGMMAALGVVCGAAGVVLAVTGGESGGVFAAALGVLMLTRARTFPGRRQRLALLISGVFTLSVVVGIWLAHVGQVLRLTLGLPAIVLLGLGVLAYSINGGTAQRSPLWGRVLDIVEIGLTLAIIPLAVWAADGYEWIRAVRGG